MSFYNIYNSGSQMMTALQTLDQSDLIEVMTLFARGYTIRHIRKFLVGKAASLGRPDMVPTEQDLLTMASRYSDDIEKHRTELAQDALARGLARKEERITRLTWAVESVETDALTGLNLKATEMYRRLIKDIGTEVEGLNIRILMPDDPWAQLLSKLKEPDALTENTPSTSLPTKANSTLESDQAPTQSTPSVPLSSNKDTLPPTPDKELSSTTVEG